MINLVYIRAAIEYNTGIRLSQREVRELLVEEGLITRAQANKDAVIFYGYGDLYLKDVPTRDIEPLDDQEGLPDRIQPL